MDCDLYMHKHKVPFSFSISLCKTKVQFLSIEIPNVCDSGRGKFYPKRFIQKVLSTNKSREKIYPEELSKTFLIQNPRDLFYMTFYNNIFYLTLINTTISTLLFITKFST